MLYEQQDIFYTNEDLRIWINQVIISQYETQPKLWFNITCFESYLELCAWPRILLMKQRGFLNSSVTKLKPIAPALTSSRKVQLPKFIKQSQTYNETEYKSLIQKFKNIYSQQSQQFGIQLKQINNYHIESSQTSGINSCSVNSFDASKFHDNTTTEVQQTIITSYKVQQSINELNFIATKVGTLQQEMEKIEKRVIDAYLNLSEIQQ